MVFKPGNQLWKARTKHGRDKIFETPDILWDACCEYFQWVEDNPLSEDKLFAYQGVITRDVVYKMRAMTLSGLCLFLDIGEETWNLYRKRDDFVGVTNRVEKIIYNQKFQGAAADLLNANIISRDLGLVDKSEVKQDSKLKVSADMSPQDASRAYQDLMGND